MDLDGLEAKARTRLNELRERQQTLSLDALSDPVVRDELRAIEIEIGSAGETLNQLKRAQVEQARRLAESVAAAEVDRRGRALAEARRLGSKRVTAAEAVDRAAAAFGETLTAYLAVCTEQVSAVRAAGRVGGAAVKPGRVSEALAFGLAAGGAPRGAVEFERLSGKPRPLSELDAPPPLGDAPSQPAEQPPRVTPEPIVVPVGPRGVYVELRRRGDSPDRALQKTCRTFNRSASDPQLTAEVQLGEAEFAATGRAA